MMLRLVEVPVMAIWPAAADGAFF